MGYVDPVETFPGSWSKRPSAEEWERADRIVGRRLERFWPPGTVTASFAPRWHNRLWLRSEVRRHLVRQLRVDRRAASAAL